MLRKKKSRKVVPFGKKSPLNDSGNYFIRHRPVTQQWAAGTVAIENKQAGCCSALGNFLGFSKTIAPWWAASILPGDNCIVKTREPWCEDPVNRDTRHGAKQFEERRAKQHARLAQVGRKVEVLVAEQRDWYVGKVVPNRFDDASPKSNLLAVRFSNGSVLLNVRPSELRQVPRSTVAYWMLVATIWAGFAVGTYLNASATVHTMRHGPLGEVWLFPDRAFEHLPNTTLYNLTYGEVAAAHAHSETWLAALLHGKVEAYRLSSIRHWFLVSQTKLLERDAGSYLVFVPLLLAFGAVMPLRRVPLSLAVSSVLCFLTVLAVESFCVPIAYQWPDEHPNEQLGQAVQRGIARVIRNTPTQTLINSVLLFFGLPHPLFSFLRRRGIVRSVSRVWVLAFLSGFVYWILMLLRMFHFTTLLDDVLATDKTLERLAFNMLYLETTNYNLSYHICIGFPLFGSILYISLKQELTWWSQVMISFFVLLIVPLALWSFVVIRPLSFLAPVTWEFLHKIVPLAATGRAALDVLMYFTMSILICVPAIASIVHKFVTAYRVSTLGEKVRESVRDWASSAIVTASPLPQNTPLEPPTKAVSPVNDYQPLNKREPSRNVIRPSTVYFESYFAQQSTGLRRTTRVPRCLALLLSTQTQMQHVLAATAVTLAGYMAHVVAGASAAQQQALRETLVEVLEDLNCTDADRELVLQIADRSQEEAYSSSVAKLREVVRRLGTKHRDQIYLRSMEGVGRETGFREFVATAERVQALVVEGLGGQVLRQSVVTDSMPWTVGVVRLLDSAYGVKDRYNAFMATLAVKSGGEFLPAPLKGLFRLSEKLWLRPTPNPNSQSPSFSRGNCANVFDVVRGMIMCTSMDALNICLGLLTACDVELWRGLQAERGVFGAEDATAAQAAGIREELDVWRVKNRFKQPTASGWADVLINFTFASDPDQHVCEVQLVHAGMLTARKHCNAHTAYAKFRSALELLETFGLAPGSTENAKAVAAADTQHVAFTQALEEEYKDFLTRYEQAVGIDTRSSSVSVGGLTPRYSNPGEVERLHEQRRQDKEEFQRQLQLIDEKYQRQIEELRSQVETLAKKHV